MPSRLVSTWSPPPHPFNRSNTGSTAPKYDTAGGKPSFLRVVVAVGLWGRLDGFVLCVAIENEAIDDGKRVELCLRRRVGAGGVVNSRGVTHRARSHQLGPLTVLSPGELAPDTQVPIPL